MNATRERIDETVNPTATLQSKPVSLEARPLDELRVFRASALVEEGRALTEEHLAQEKLIAAELALQNARDSLFGIRAFLESVETELKRRGNP